MTDFASLGLKVDSREVKTGVSELDKLTASGGRAEKSSQRLTAATRELGTAFAALGIAGVGATIARVTQMTSQFQDAMAEVSTLVDEARWSMAELNKVALDQAKLFGSSPLLQAKAQYQIISAGAIDAAKATEILTAANKLAVGGVTDVKTAADGLTSVLNAYGSAAGSATEVSDALFVAMKGGKTTIAELSSNLGKVAPLAASAGVQFDELASAVSAITKGGVATTEAVTGVRAILAAVAKPADEAAEVAKKLGLEFNSAAVKSQGFGKFLDDVVTKTKGNQDALAKLFGGVEALVPVLALAGQAGLYFDENMANMAKRAGETEAAFAKMANSPGFKWNQMVAAFTVEAMKLGTALLTVMVPAMTAITTHLSKIIDVTLAAAAGFAAFKAALLATAAAQAIMSSTFALHIALIATTARSLGVLAAAQVLAAGTTTALAVAMRTAISIALGPIGIAITAAAIAYGFLTGKIGAAAQANGVYAQSTAAVAKLQGEVTDITNGLVAATGKERAEMMLAAQAKRASAIQAGVLAVQNYRAAQSELALANARKGPSTGGGLINPLRAIDYIFDFSGAKQARANVEAAGKAVGDYDKQIKQLDKAIADASKPVKDLGAGMIDLSDKTDKAKKKAEDASLGFKSFLEGLELDLRNIGKSEIEIKKLDIAAEAAAADKAGFGALAKKIREVGGALVLAMDMEETFAKAKERRKNDADLVGAAERELALLGLTGEARDKAALKMEYESQKAKILAGDINNSTTALDDWHQKSLEVIEGKSALEREARAARDLVDALGLVADQASVTADIMGNAFGNIGDVFGGIVASMADYQAQSAELAEQVKKGAITEENAKKRLATLDMKNTAQAISGVKSLFKEKSTAYKVMQAIEMAYAAFQMVNTIKSIALDKAKTGSSILNSAARATADGVAAVAKAIASLPFPLNLAAGAATAAALVAFGVKLFGGGAGGGGGGAPTSAEDVQAAQGTGSVLGDSKAKSESIARSLELMAANTNEMLEYDNAMLRSLRKIEQGIEAMAASIAKELSLPGGAFDQDRLGLGTKSNSGFLGLFGSSTTKTLFDQGVEFFTTSLGDAIANGLSGQTYQIVEKVKKKSGFLGIGGGTKTSYTTTTQGVDPDISQQIGLILSSIRESVIEAAKVLGLNVTEALDQFQVEIGKISFKDMSADEISQTLSAVFSKVADQMAGFAVEGLEEFQKAGEGLFETLMRLAKNYITIDTSLKSIGKTFGMVGASSIALRENLIALFGSLEDFVDQVAFYQANFLSGAEQIAPVRAAVEAELARLGLSYVDTRAEFNAVVQSIDLTTEAGQELFAALMALAPAFDAVEQYEEQQVQKAMELAKQKASLEIQLLEAQGKAAEALAKKRELELAALDPSLRALQQQVWAAQDVAAAKNRLLEAYKRERSELEQTISKFGDLAKSLRAYRDTLFGGGTGSIGYNAALAKLIATGGLAASGDATALGDLQGASKTFLDVAKDRASTLQQYQRDVALVAQYVDQGISAAEGQMSAAEKQLKALETQVGKLVDINESVLSVKDAIIALNKLLSPSGATPAPSAPGGRPPRDRQGRSPKNDNERMDRIEQRLDRIAAAAEQSAISANRTARTLRDWDRGGSLAVATDDDTPLLTSPSS